MLVSVSGRHSSRICAFHESFCVLLWLSELEKELVEPTKFSEADSDRTSELRWFHLTEPFSESVLPSS